MLCTLGKNQIRCINELSVLRKSRTYAITLFTTLFDVIKVDRKRNIPSVSSLSSPSEVAVLSVLSVTGTWAGASAVSSPDSAVTGSPSLVSFSSSVFSSPVVAPPSVLSFLLFLPLLRRFKLLSSFEPKPFVGVLVLSFGVSSDDSYWTVRIKSL